MILPGSLVISLSLASSVGVSAGPQAPVMQALCSPQDVPQAPVRGQVFPGGRPGAALIKGLRWVGCPLSAVPAAQDPTAVPASGPLPKGFGP